MIDNRNRVESYPAECVEKFADLALQCCEDRPEDRPSMLDVVRELEIVVEMMQPKHKESDSLSSEFFSNSFGVGKGVTSSSSCITVEPRVPSELSGSNLVSDLTPTIWPR